MNSEIRKIIQNRNIHFSFYKKIGNVYLLGNNSSSYIIKLNTNNYDIYKYLLSRDFLGFPPNYSLKDDHYDMYEYIEDIKEEKAQKIEDLIDIISILHKKTAYLREIDLDEMKEIYEGITNKINETRNYYLKINDIIDNEIFMSPSHYLLVRNISVIYNSLEYANRYINEWYDIVKNEKSSRIVLLHNNIDINHLIINDNKYLISWDKAYFDNPIYDIENLYRKYFYDIELLDALRIYEKNNKLTALEYKLLMSRLLIPNMIYLSSKTINDVEIINNEILFLTKIMYFTK